LLLAYVALWLFAPARAASSALLIDLSVGCCAIVQIVGFNLKAQFVVLLLPALAATWSALGTGKPGERILLALAGLAFLVCPPGLVGRAASNLLLAHSAMAIGTLLLATALVVQRLTPPPTVARTAAPGAGTAP
jgi:hypothetical protein